MWVFKSKYTNSFLATNPKVLTQTLLRQKSLERFLSKRRYWHFAVKELNPTLGPEYVMLARNPYKRVESYFREKLRQKVAMVFDRDEPYILKRHQLIFYDYLGLRRDDPLQKQVDELNKLDFKSFVKLIPALYKLEDHLSPQTYNYSRKILGTYHTMKMNRYVRIENEDEMKWVADYFQLDLSIRMNDSSDVNEKIEWDKECITVIQKVYKDDFSTFGYDPEFPGNIAR